MEPILELYRNLCGGNNCPSCDLVLASFGAGVNVVADWKMGVVENAELISPVVA